MRWVLLLLCVLLPCSNAKAESVFSLDARTDIVLGTITLGVLTGYLLIENPPNQVPDSLSRSDVNALDRSLMVTRLNPSIKSISDVTVVSMGFLPVLSVVGNLNRNTLITYGVMYSQAMLLAHGTNRLLKNNITRFRPYLHDGRALSVNDRHDSFPSGHTCAAFLFATFFATTFSMENPDSRWKWPVIAGSHVFAASVGAMRMLSGMHFLTDVLAGAAIGSFYGWLIPYLHRNTASNTDFPVAFTGNGLLVSLRL